ESAMKNVLDVTNANFPTAKLTPADVISTWAGLRPLIGGNGNETGKPSDISRAHQIRMTQPGWFDVAGGKLTTYRLMAEQMIDRAVNFLGVNVKPCETATTPLLAVEPMFSGILPPPVTREAVEHFVRNEWAVHVCDVMTRRTGWRYYHREHASLARQVAQWMSEILGWSPEQMENELARYDKAIDSAACGCAGALRHATTQKVQPA